MPERIAYAADHVLHTADFARFGFVAGIVEVVEAGLILLLYLVFVLFAQSGDLGDDLRIVLVELAGSGDFRFIPPSQAASRPINAARKPTKYSKTVGDGSTNGINRK